MGGYVGVELCAHLLGAIGERVVVTHPQAKLLGVGRVAAAGLSGLRAILAVVHVGQVRLERGEVGEGLAVVKGALVLVLFILNYFFCFCPSRDVHRGCG